MKRSTWLVVAAFCALCLLYTNCSRFEVGASPFDSASAVLGSSSQPSTSVFKPSTLSSVELIQNGDFESGKTGWADFGNTEILAGAGRNGTSALHLLGTAAGGVQQIVPAEAGKRYRVTCFAKTSFGNQGTIVRTTISVTGQPDVSFYANAYSSDYQRLTYDVDVPAGVTSFPIVIWNNGGDDGTYFDDFSVREITNLVTPQALFDEGDSISAGPHSGMYASGEADLFFNDQAVGGSGLGLPTDTTQNSIYARLPAMLAKVQTHLGAVVTVLIGANDLAANDPTDYANRLFQYADAIRSQGAKIAIGTVLPQGTALLPSSAVVNTKRIVLNNLIRAAVGQRIDAVIDYGGDPIMGLDATADNKTYFVDGLHPTWNPGGGQDLMSRVYRKAVNSLLGR